MKMLLQLSSRIKLLLFVVLTSFSSFPVIAQETEQIPVLIHAARVFDGNSIRTNTSVLVVGGIVAKMDNREAFKSSDAKIIDLGDATLLPGFIELQAHLAFQHILADVVLKHGITTLLDVGELCTSLMVTAVCVYSSGRCIKIYY
jgi:adenine deaminase